MTTTYTRRTLLTRTAATLLAVTLTLTVPAVGTAADPPKRTQPEIDAKWKPLADEYSQVLRMEALAALANKSDPKKYPLPAPTPFQKAVMAMADKAKPEVRKKALERATQTAALPANQLNAQFGRIAGVTPNGKTSVQAQYEKLVAGRKSLINRAMLDAAAGGDVVKEVGVLKKASGSAPPVNAVKTLRLELLEFHCVDDTRGSGDDEVRMGGTAIKVNGKTGKVNSFFLGSFSDKQKKVYNPNKKLCDFDLTLTNTYPKSGAFILSVAEEDWEGTHQDAIEAITDLVKKKVKKELDGFAEDAGKALADLMKSDEFGAILGDVTGNVFDAVIDAVFGWLADFFEDDLFVPIRIPFNVKKPEVWANGATHGADKNYTLKGHGGHYKFKVRWAKVN
jgi:hypothetical protein